MTEQHLGTFTLLPTTRKTLDEAEANATGLIDALASWAIATDEDAAQAGALLREVHDDHKRLDTMRKEAGKPAREAIKDINQFFKPVLDALSTAKGTLKGKLDEHQRAAQEARRVVLEQVAAGDAGALAQVAPSAPVAGVQYRSELDIQITDFDKIPREYLTVDWSKLKLRAREGKPAPAGVSFVVQQKAMVGR